MEKALSDVTVLDLGQVIAMPFCTMLLADMGARVIKVESLEQAKERLSLGMKRVRNGVEERVPVYQYRDRNKQAITLNLKTPQGVALFKELVQHVDVVTENFSVGTMERLGLGYHVAAGDQSSPYLRSDYGVWPVWPVCPPTWVRHPGTGDQRLYEYHRLS